MSQLLVAQRALTVPAWVKNELWRRAQAIPSLDLRFADNKSLVDAVTGQQLVTFTRAGSGTFVDSARVLQTAATDVPRFDHNPTTGESLGLLVEEQRTNLVLSSEEFDNASWTAVEATITANQIAAPNGTTTADLYTTSGSTGVEHYVTQVFTAASSTIYTASVYVKAGTNSAFGLQYRVGGAWVGGNVLASFNISTQVATVDSGTATVSITPAGNGWFRCRITATSSVAGGSPQFRVATVDGAGTIYLWGAQLEAGAFPTSYIPTTTAAATRSADVASITGSAFSSWYRQDEGTMFADFRLNGIASQNKVVNADAGGGFANSVDIYCISGIPRFDVWESSAAQAQLSPLPASSIGVNVDSRTTGVYKFNDFAATRNGGTLVTDTAGIVPTTTRLVIGNQNASNYLNGTIRRLSFWPQRLANSVLQNITQ